LQAARRAARALLGQGLAFQTLFCHWMIKFSNPGSDRHCGSSFPMRRTPSQPLYSDALGRPFGWSRIFIVDSSVLPSIPGTTLAFATMANADRIATSAPLQEGRDR
jgi:choline dehydrogenase-like flavoprotein